MSKPPTQFRWWRFIVALTLNLVAHIVAIMFAWSVLSTLAAHGNTNDWWTRLAILAICLSGLRSLVGTRALIVAWQIEEQEIVFQCVGRLKSVTCPLNEVSLVKWETHGRVIGYELQGSTIPRLWIDARYLVDADELVQQLSLRIPKCRKKLSGALSYAELLVAVFRSGLLISCFLCPVLVGGLVIRGGLNATGQPTQQLVAFSIGLALICAGAIGIAFMQRVLPPTVIRVDVSGDRVVWWRLGWPFMHVRSCSDVAELSIQQPATRPVGRPSARFHVRFADGVAFDMDEATLPNARALAEMIGPPTPKLIGNVHDEPRMSAETPLAPVDEKLAKEVQIHLAPGERLLWAGRLVPEQLPVEYAAPRQTGVLILLAAAAAAGVMLAAMGWSGVGMIWPVLIIFLVAGIVVMVSYGRVNRRLQTTLYAVTDRRAIVVGGLAWAGGNAYFNPHHENYSLLPDVVRGYRIEHDGRNIVLTSEWHVVRGRRRTREAQIQIGFIAVDDPVGAVNALQRLTNQSELSSSAPTAPTSNAARYMRDGGIAG